MYPHKQRIFPVLFSLGLMLSGCSQTTQTTSGQSYLSQYQDVVHQEQSIGINSSNINQKVREVAAIEPILKFPARIGIARIEDAQLTNIPGEEMEAWLKVRHNLGGESLGEFVVVNPMVADLASSSVNMSSTSLVNKIRLGAARQHLDAVLLYEVYSKTDSKTNFLAIADITIIGGYILPSEQVEAEGFANAMLIDVIQGYPYGTADITIDKETALTPSNYEYEKEKKQSSIVKTKAAIALAPEVETMIRELKYKLAQVKAK